MAKNNILKLAGIGFRNSLIMIPASLLMYFVYTIVFVQSIGNPSMRFILMIGSVFLSFIVNGWFLNKFRRFIYGR